MKAIRSNCEEINKPVKIVEGIVEKRQTLPILSNLLIEQDGVNVKFSTTDLDIQICTEAAVGVADTKCRFTVNAGKMTSILNAVSGKDILDFDVTDNKLTIQSQSGQFALQTLPADDYPVISEGRWENSLTLPARQLRYLFTMTSFAMAVQDVRFFLNGMLFVMDKNIVRTVATDTHRLACCDITVQENFEHFQTIIPRKTIRELIRLLPDDDTPVQVQFTDTQVKFSFSNITFMSKLIEGKFPDYNRVLPSVDSNPKFVLLDREQLASALRLVGIMTSEKFHGVRWILNKTTLQIQSVNNDHEEAIETLPINWEYEGMDMGFNITYLAEVLSILKTKDVKFNFSTAAGSVLITMPDSPDRFRYVVMPMRI